MEVITFEGVAIDVADKRREGDMDGLMSMFEEAVIVWSVVVVERDSLVLVECVSEVVDKAVVDKVVVLNEERVDEVLCIVPLDVVSVD